MQTVLLSAAFYQVQVLLKYPISYQSYNLSLKKDSNTVVDRQVTLYVDSVRKQWSVASHFIILIGKLIIIHCIGAVQPCVGRCGLQVVVAVPRRPLRGVALAAVHQPADALVHAVAAGEQSEY